MDLLKSHSLSIDIDSVDSISVRKQEQQVKQPTNSTLAATILDVRTSFPLDRSAYVSPLTMVKMFYLSLLGIDMNESNEKLAKEGKRKIL